MHYYTYILQSEINGRFYIGSCSDVEKRLQRHNAGATPSTKPYRPWMVAYTEKFETKMEALQRERYIKSMKSREFIESLIQAKKG